MQVLVVLRESEWFHQVDDKSGRISLIFIYILSYWDLFRVVHFRFCRKYNIH